MSHIFHSPNINPIENGAKSSYPRARDMAGKRQNTIDRIFYPMSVYFIALSWLPYSFPSLPICSNDAFYIYMYVCAIVAFGSKKESSFE
jgi:hypothetical protein